MGDTSAPPNYNDAANDPAFVPDDDAPPGYAETGIFSFFITFVS